MYYIQVMVTHFEVVQNKVHHYPLPMQTETCYYSHYAMLYL